MAGGFFDEAEFFEARKDFAGLGEGNTELVFDLVGGDGWLFEEIVEERVRAGHATEGVGDLLVSGFTESDDIPGGGDGIPRDGGDALEEEFDPAFPIALLADGGEAVVVFEAVEFEIVGEVKEGKFQDIAMAEEEGDEETADAAIAIEEGMDRLELGMGVGAVDEGGDV